MKDLSFLPYHGSLEIGVRLLKETNVDLAQAFIAP